MSKKIRKKIFLLSISFLVFTEVTYGITFSELIINLSNNIIGTISKLAFGFAVLFFFWGIFSFVINIDDPNKRQDGAKRILFGIIAIFVMLSIWGILYFLQETVKLKNDQQLEIKLNNSSDIYFPETNYNNYFFDSERGLR